MQGSSRARTCEVRQGKGSSRRRHPSIQIETGRMQHPVRPLICVNLFDNINNRTVTVR